MAILRRMGKKYYKAQSILGYDYFVKLGDNFSQSNYLNKYDNIPEIISCSAFCQNEKQPVILDVGAHDGFFCTQLEQTLKAVPDHLIYAFEPTAPTFVDLHHQVTSLNSRRIKIVPLALSDASEWVSISHEARNSMLAQIIPSSGVPRLTGNTFVGASMTLDSFVQKFSLQPSVLKVDVEGFELNVLRGAKQTLERYSPGICLEWNPETAALTGSSMQAILDILSSYRFFYLNDYEGQRLTFTSEVRNPMDINWTCNLVCVPGTLSRVETWKENLKALCMKYQLDLTVC